MPELITHADGMCCCRHIIAKARRRCRPGNKTKTQRRACSDPAPEKCFWPNRQVTE